MEMNEEGGEIPAAPRASASTLSHPAKGVYHDEFEWKVD